MTTEANIHASSVQGVPQKEVQLLILENDRLDVMRIRKYLLARSAQIHCHSIAEGHQAMDFLQKREEFQSAPDPDIIILNVNLPQIDGYQIIDFIKLQPHLKNTPVIVVMPENLETAEPKKVRYLVNTKSIKEDLLGAMEAATMAVDQYLID